MNTADTRLWPFSARAGLLCALATLAVLMLVVLILRITQGWPDPQSESTVLLGVLIVALIPLALALIDLFVARGAVIEYAGVKLAFSQSRELGSQGLTVPANIGVKGQVVADSGTTQILDALRQSSAHEVVTIDLEDGQAWWETRLFVLLAGAQRLGRPSKVIFVGKDANKAQQFQGWGHAADLLAVMVKSNPQFERSLLMTRGAAAQLALAEPGEAMVVPPWKPMFGPLATRYQWMAFDTNTGLPNTLFAEQALQSELGQKVEQLTGTRGISLIRLQEIFRPVLSTNAIDLSWSADRQLEEFLKTDDSYVAITQEARFSSLVPRLTLLNQLLTPLLRGASR